MFLRTLGGLGLEGADFSRPKPLLLLAYLAIEGSRERRYLAELFWGGAARPRERLATALWEIRKGATGVVGADRVRAWGEVESDAQAVLLAADRNEPERVHELYRGPFLDGVDLSGCGIELEEWIYGTREYLASRFRTALLVLGERAARRGEFDTAARLAERAHHLVEAPPFEPEDLARVYTLMVAGESARATELRREAEQFGLTFTLTPAEARGRFPEEPVGVRRETPHNLVLPGTSFVGRDMNLVELGNHLARSGLRLLTVVGSAGVGKTRLALQLALDQLKLGTFRGGIYFVALDAVTDPSLLPSRIAEAIGVDRDDSDGTFEQLARFIADKPLLLVLDNIEQLIGGAGVTADLLGRCPNLKLLVTSRERLNLAEEAVYLLEGLEVPPAAGASWVEARNEAAVRLFVERAKSTDLHFKLTPENLTDVVRICRLVEGSPLGIELAAVWVRLLAPAEIATEIERNLDFLATPTRNVPGRHQTIRAAFEHSWKLLSANEQEVLRKLSVFRGGFNRAAAGEVVGASIPLLASLVDKSLLRVLPNGRYDRHPLTYQFIWEKLAEQPDEQEHCQERHALYFLAVGEEAAADLEGEEQTRWLNRLEEEHDNLYAAWQWIIASHRLEMGLKLATALTYTWRRSWKSWRDAEEKG